MARWAVVMWLLFFTLPAYAVSMEKQDTPSENRGQHAVFRELGVDWMGGLRYGVERRVGASASIRTHIGLTVFGVVTADLLGALRLFEAPDKFQLNLLAGVPTAAAPLSMDGAMISFGGSIELRFFPWRRAGVAFRLGAGYPLFIENGSIEARNISFPFDLWPDALLAIVWPR